MQGRPSTMIPVNPFDSRARPDPYPVYQYMRTVEPVHKSPVGFWVLTRFDDCRDVLEDKRWSHDADRILEPARGQADPVDMTVRLLRASVAFTDAAMHARHRRPLELAVRSSTRGAEARAAGVAAGLLKLLRERESDADLIRDYAAPLTVVVLSDLMGFPTSDRALLLRLANDLAAGIDPNIQAPAIVKAGAAAAALSEYMIDRLDQAGAAGGVVGALSGKPRKLRTWELIADLTVLFVIGVETTRNLVGNAMLALLRNPDQLNALRQRPALMALGLEELIRFDGPLHLTARSANEDVDVAGHKIAAGEQAVLLLAAANRDPARFTDPDRLDLARKDNPHLGFGAGAHACFAAPLARQIVGSALSSIVPGLADLELAGEPSWFETVTMRGLRKLPIRFKR
jgi:pimeloyl-[acyl-carrier protein] synthase